MLDHKINMRRSDIDGMQAGSCQAAYCFLPKIQISGELNLTVVI